MTDLTAIFTYFADGKEAYGVKEVLLLLLSCIVIFLIAYFPVGIQSLLSNLIDDWKFKRKKFSAFSALFRTVCGQSVGDYGLVCSMFVIQLFGYILCLCAVIAFVVLAVVLPKGQEILVISIVMSIALAAEIVCDLIVIFITAAISKKRKSKYVIEREKEGFYYKDKGKKVNVITGTAAERRRQRENEELDQTIEAIEEDRRRRNADR